MSSDPRMEFKVGFLQKAAQLGIGPEQLSQLLEGREKEAGWADWIPGAGIAQHAAKKLIDVGANVATNLSSQALPATIGATTLLPLAGGAVGGHLLARAQNAAANEDPDEEKKRELIDAYRSATERLELMRRARQKRDKSRERVSFGVL